MVDGRGVATTVAGAAVGAAVGIFVAAIALIPPATDAPNGFWHDADGWLLWFAPPIVLGALLVGAWTALRFRALDRRLTTVGLMVPFMLAGLVATWLSGSLTAWSVLTPQVAAIAGARLVATSKAMRISHFAPG